jgi:hypothetical protein
MVNSEIIPLYTQLTIIYHEFPHDIMDYPLVNSQFDPESHHFLMETECFPSPMTARVELLIYQRI